VGGGSKLVQAAEPPYFNDASSESSYVGSNNDVIDIVGGIITPYPPMPHDWTKLQTNPRQKAYIDSVYVSKRYAEPPSAERQKAGFDPAANYRFNRADTNLIDSTVDVTVQENTRKSSLNVPKREMTRAVKFSNDSVTTSIRPNSVGSLGNTNVGFYRTKLNTDNTTTRIILTPDSKQVLLSDESVQQQVILFQEDND
jgi:hypothetical protein